VFDTSPAWVLHLSLRRWLVRSLGEALSWKLQSC
jgi:hypothetical protein